MSIPLYLTAEERMVFEKLPAKVREGWIVMEEMLTSYETERQLKVRRNIFRRKDPAFEALLAKLEGMKEPGSFDDAMAAIGCVPKSLIMNLLFTMGAGFLRECVQGVLGSVKIADDLRAVAELSGLRHLLLESNLKPASSPHTS